MTDLTLTLQSAGNPHHSVILNNFAIAVKNRFEQSWDLPDLDKAIKLHEEVGICTISGCVIYIAHAISGSRRRGCLVFEGKKVERHRGVSEFGTRQVA